MLQPAFGVRARRLGRAIEADMAACGIVQEMERLALMHRNAAVAVARSFRA